MSGARVPRATPAARAQQVRRRELHDMSVAKLERIYASRAGRLIHEVRAMTAGLDDAGKQVLIDGIVRSEFPR